MLLLLLLLSRGRECGEGRILGHGLLATSTGTGTAVAAERIVTQIELLPGLRLGLNLCRAEIKEVLKVVLLFLLLLGLHVNVLAHVVAVLLPRLGAGALTAKAILVAEVDASGAGAKLVVVLVLVVHEVATHCSSCLV